MEIKKSSKADLENWKGLFLEIGLVISLLITVGAFMYAPTEYRIEQVDLQYAPIEEEITEITRNEEKPQAPPQKVEIKVFNDILDIVTNDSKVTTEMTFFEDFDEGMEIETTVVEVEVEEEEIEEDQPFIKVEKMPTFRGGDLNQFRNWVQGRLRYPQIAQENGISGRVVLSFVVERDGKVSNIQVLQSPDKSLAEEATRVVSNSPKWEPGMQSNKPVRVKYTLPVVFQIQN